MRRLIQVESFKLRKRPMAWILLALAPVLVAAIYGMLFAVVAAAPAGATNGTSSAEFRAALDFRNVARFADGLVFRTAAIAAIILAGVSTASEYRWRTASFSTAWSGERGRLIVARTAVYAVFAVAAVVLGLATATLCSFAINASRATLDTSDGADLPVALAASAARDGLLVMVYVTLAVAVASWSRSAALAVALPLVALLLEPLGVGLLGAAGGTIASAGRFTLTENVDAVLAANGAMKGSPVGIPEGLPSPWESAIFLATFCLISVAAAIGAARRDLGD